MEDKNFRNMEKAPVPLHAIDTGLVESMHGELYILYALAGMSNSGLAVLYRQSFETGHLWNYDADLVRVILLDVFADRVSPAAAKALRGEFTTTKGA